MKKLCFHPMFGLGLAIRLILIFGMAPLAVSQWYAPFLDATTSSVTLNPWSEWLASGGTPDAFPYGYVMWLVLIPLTLVAKLFGVSNQFGYEFTLLIADFLLMVTLSKLLPNRERLVLVAYWLSPIVIVATYGLGLNDIIPILFLAVAILCMRRLEMGFAGALCALAISAKLSMIVALPFIAIYLYHNRSQRQLIPSFVKGFAICGAVVFLPFLLTRAGPEMLASNPEIGKISAFSIELGTSLSIYFVPLVYLVILYLAWRVRRINFELFVASVGLAFLLIALMTPATPGWFVWSVPFLVIYQALSGRVAITLVAVFSGLYVVSVLFVSTIKFSNGYILDISELIASYGFPAARLSSLVYTMMVAVGVILAIRMLRESINRNDFFRLSRKPFVMGVAGDSGAGKDTYVAGLLGLFGSHSVVQVSGDDYHLWDRQKPMWQVMTHLNPRANDLEGFSSDIVALTDGKSVSSRHYDHSTGQMSKPFRVQSNDLIIASGLHALYLPILRDCYNLKIFLAIDEGLRRHFKIQRDVGERGHSLERVLESFEKREEDSERFIRPQAGYADLVLSLQPIHPRMLSDQDERHPLRMKLVARTSLGFNEVSLSRVLVGVCGLHVDVEVSDDGSQVEVTIEGETSAEDVALAAQLLCPQVLEFLDIYPKWQDGIGGLMQLVTLTHINQALTKRIIP